MGILETSEMQKQKIYDFINNYGPNLPVRISSRIGMDSIIVSAYLSELLSDKKLKLSNMKVGSSPIYYSRGQEFQLINFANYLSGKERDAFELLKEEGILEDEKMLPAIRVALRSIKDFAFPIQHQNKLYWRFLKINENEAIAKIEELQKNSKPKKEVEREIILPEPKPQIIEEKPKPQSLIERGLSTTTDNSQKERGFEIKRETEFIEKKEIPSNEKEQKLEIFDKKPEQKKEVKNKGEKSEFVEEVIRFLNEKFKIIEEISFKKKEYNCKMEIETQLGKILVYCIAKEKKSVGENDITIAIQKSTEEKMPILLLYPAEMNKKSKEKIQEAKNIVFFQKLESKARGATAP